MAVTSPLAPLSPLRAVGRGNLCAPVMPQKSPRTLGKNTQPDARSHRLRRRHTDASAYVAFVLAAEQTF